MRFMGILTTVAPAMAPTLVDDPLCGFELGLLEKDVSLDVVVGGVEVKLVFEGVAGAEEGESSPLVTSKLYSQYESRKIVTLTH